MEKLQPPLRRPEAEAVRWAEVGRAVASIVTRDPETGVWRGLHALAASDIGGHWPLSLTASLTGDQPHCSLSPVRPHVKASLSLSDH